MKLLSKNIFLFLLVSYCSLQNTSCKKYLSKKENQSLVVPETIQDLQSLLDAYNVINNNDPVAGEVSADDYYLTYNDWSSLDEYTRRIYTWEQANLFRPGNFNDWVFCFTKVYTANVVLDNIDNVQRSPNDQNSWNNTKGCALFIRAKAFTQAAWIWSLAYDKNTASADLGIPLRLTSDFNIPSVRSTVQETYDRIIADFKEAIDLLPAVPVHVMRPSKPAACGWLARVYLSMGNYDSAFVYADKCLQFHDSLMDYNSLDASATAPIASFNPEVIYQSVLRQPVYPPLIKVDSFLYASYSNNDLRKTIMFTGAGNNEFTFRGSYDGSNWEGSFFGGIATDEVYLMRAECSARMGNTASALNDLNTLLLKRYKKGTFIPYTKQNTPNLLDTILLERRKELYFRGTRWIDIKRLNKEGANIILKRILNGETFILSPNDARYALPIPEDVIKTSHMQQNPG